ncbi:efflux RND transporter permease subunit [Desulfoluna spongiiphila]|uniref:efflux RND transporter permease subunit n=1 Tax=Desulfoluna spongiiphila TaxID=419481 RepID=UPI0012536EF7|nr:MMPL family transporter [Desulfoluna spongiiphila]VVS94325.1 membrane transport protein mmpl domain [Desulfoluna spongiiphila]
MRNTLLNGLMNLTLHHRWVVWCLTVALTGLSVWASGLIVLDVRWSTLLPESDPKVMEYKMIDRAFLQPGNMIVAISGPDEAALERITDEVTATLESKMLAPPGASLDDIKASQRYARHVYGKAPEEWLNETLLWLTKPKDTRRYRDLWQDPRLLPYLTHLNDDFEREYTDSENVQNKEREIVASLDAVQGLADALMVAASGAVDPQRTQRVVRDLTVGRPYMFSLDNRMSLVLVASAIPSDDAQTVPLVDKKVEELLAPLQEKYPDYRIERTGLTSVFRDEMDAVGPQTQALTLLAFSLVFLLLAWNFRSVVIPFIALVPIVIGIFWTMGVIGLVLGTMNIITVMIMVVLLGLGIDFSIHLVSRFFEELKGGCSPEAALRLSIGGTGTGVITGAITSSIAFFMLMVAETRGIYEFGFCSGVGVLVQLLAVFWMLPSLMMAYAQWRIRKNKGIPVIREISFLHPATRFAARRRVWIAGVSVLLMSAGVFAGTQLKWEWNFMELEPKGLRSVALQDEIVEQFKMSTTVSWFTAPDVEASRAYRKKLKEKRPIGDVDDISLWVSRPDADKNRPFIRELRAHSRQKNPAHDYTAPSLQARFFDELDRLWANLIEIQALSITGGQDRVVEKTRRLVSVRDSREKGLLRKLADRYRDPAMVGWDSLAKFDGVFRTAMTARVEKALVRDEPITLDEVPQKYHDRYVSNEEPGYLVRIFPKQNLYRKQEMEVFQNVVTRTSENVTGPSQMIYKMNTEMIREGRLAFILGTLVILLVLFADFRSLGRGLAPMVPLVAGLSLLTGLLWLVGQKLNYINVIGLTVIVGIGVDNGVHILHRALREGPDRLPEAVASVGRAVILSSLTTMIGFGSLMLYVMRGMASLGLLLFAGVGFCLLASCILLPAVIAMFSKKMYPQSIGDQP